MARFSRTSSLHPIPRISVLSALLMAALLTGIAGVAEASSAPVASGDLQLEPRPLWVSSAAWSLDGTSLLVVDALESRVVAYPVGGGGGRPVEIGSSDDRAVLRPSILHAIDGSYLLEEEDALIVRLDGDFRVTGSYDLLVDGKGAGRSITGMYYWVPLSGDEILGFAEIELAAAGEKARAVSAFVRVPLSRPADFAVLDTVEHDDPARDYYRVGYPYLAAVAGRGYYLLMDRQPSLVAVGGETAGSGTPFAAALPAEVALRPELPSGRAPGGVKQLFDALGAAEIPVGLYGWGGTLYLLSRTAAEPARLTLTAYSPSDGSQGGSVVLPVSPPHPLVVPGSPEWAVVLKGSVEGLGKQRTERVVMVPAVQLPLAP